jgi:hypothetical protein
MDAGRDLVRDFETCALPAEAFHHRDHIRVAWMYLRQMDYPAAEKRMSDAIRKFAGAHGANSKYHHTLTLAWMRLVAAAIRDDPRIDDFDCFSGAHPELFDPAAPKMFYSPGLLQSEAARCGWVEPDIRTLP